MIAVIFYLFISLNIGNDKFKNVKNLLNQEQIQLIKKYIFPYKLISQKQKKISQQQKKLNLIKNTINWSEIELLKKKEGNKISTEENIVKISNDKELKKFRLKSGFYSGIYQDFPGSGYIDFYKDNLIIVSSRGVLAFKRNIEDVTEDFQQIKNNINDFIGIKQFKKSQSFSIKDISILNSKVFISYTEEIKEDCWNTSVIYGDVNYENIKFEKLFTSKNCINSENNPDKEFKATQAGGRIVQFDDNNILLSIGEYRNRYLAQDIMSVNGKIIKVNIDNFNYEIISMGHRNPQGLYYDKKNNFILETEHGPFGGDEINLIDMNKINKDKIQNFGWAISSAGEHYGKKKENEAKYKKYPLYNSHAKHGFIEPLKSFVPAIGISEIIKIESNRYVVSSLRDKSIYFFKIDELKKIINFDRVEVFERVRDLKFKKNKLYLFLEDTASIGVIDLK